jgi:hypothetical protein
MTRALLGLVLLLTAAPVIAGDAPRIEPQFLASADVTEPEIEIAPIVMEDSATFTHTIVTDVDLTVIEIFSI